MATVTYSGVSGQVLFGTSDAIESVNDVGDTIVITMTGHAFLIRNPIYITDVLGMTDLNNYWVVSAKATNTITVPCITAQSYTSGGTVWNNVPITEWTLDINTEVKDTTDSGDVSNGEAWATCIESGVKKVSGSFTGYIQDGATRPGINTKIKWYLHTDGTDNFAIDGYITGQSIPLSVVEGDAVKVTYTFQGTASLVETNA